MKSERHESTNNLREVIISMLGDELMALMEEEMDEKNSKVQIHNLAVVCNFLAHAARKNGDKELERYAFRILKASEN